MLLFEWLVMDDGGSTALVAYQTKRESEPRYRVELDMVDDPHIYLSNDHLGRWKITTPNTTTGVWEAAAGLAITLRISATLNGAAIGSLSVDMTEYSGLTGTYYAVLDQGAVNTDLAAYENQRVFEIIDDSAGVQSYRELIVLQRAA